MFSMNRLLLLIIIFRLIKKSYLLTIPGRTYFSHVKGSVQIVCNFHKGDFLQQWVEDGPIATCDLVHPIDHIGYKIEDVFCAETTASMKVTLLEIKTFYFICYSNACINTNFTLQPLYNDKGQLRPVDGSKPKMQRKFTLKCNIGFSPDVTWFYGNGDILKKYHQCTDAGGNSSRFSDRIHFSCDLSQKVSVLSFVPILLSDGNFSIMCITDFHGSEYNVRTVDTRKLITHEVGTVFIQPDRTAKFVCSLNEGDSLQAWKGDNFTANCSGSHSANQLKFYALNVTCDPKSSTLHLLISHRISKMEIFCDSYLKKRSVFKVETAEPTTSGLGDDLPYVVAIIMLIIVLILLICFNSICFMTDMGRHYWIRKAETSETSVSSRKE